MDARDFLEIAQRMCSSKIEAERRTSIGRAYYGLFHVLLAALSDRGVIFRGIPEDHQTLISYLSKGQNKTAAAVGAALKDLRQERNRADYSLKEFCNENNTQFVYRKATQALRQFDSLTESDIAALVATIQGLR